MYVAGCVIIARRADLQSLGVVIAKLNVTKRSLHEVAEGHGAVAADLFNQFALKRRRPCSHSSLHFLSASAWVKSKSAEAGCLCAWSIRGFADARRSCLRLLPG